MLNFLVSFRSILPNWLKCCTLRKPAYPEVAKWLEHNAFNAKLKSTVSGSTELKTYIICSFILYLKFVIATGIQATKTFDAGCRPPEDKNLALAQDRREQNYGLFNDENDTELRKAREIEHRWKRIIQNDLESIPLALLVFLGGVFAGGNKELYVVCLAVYTFARCSHTYACANMLQPHRAWCWRIGVLMIVTSGVNSIVGVFNLKKNISMKFAIFHVKTFGFQ
ncbi:hypothetical protein V7S43_011785 [Phytophthora oleae]|uniref:Microsomal glutathione S-transferase 1 n=1 Tax=Phytophthora oleae TaxID=2107226 RepID=A0ABD3FBS1_9STRA